MPYKRKGGPDAIVHLSAELKKKIKSFCEEKEIYMKQWVEKELQLALINGLREQRNLCSLRTLHPLSFNQAYQQYKER